jgi:hypothetical protein
MEAYCECDECICALYDVKSAIWGELKSKIDNWESIDADRVRSMGPENVAEVGKECDKPGGVSEPGVMT